MPGPKKPNHRGRRGTQRKVENSNHSSQRRSCHNPEKATTKDTKEHEGSGRRSNPLTAEFAEEHRGKQKRQSFIAVAFAAIPKSNHKGHEEPRGKGMAEAKSLTAEFTEEHRGKQEPVISHRGVRRGTQICLFIPLFPLSSASLILLRPLRSSSPVIDFRPSAAS